MSIVGTAYVVVRAISPGLKRDIASAVEKAGEKAAPALRETGEKVGAKLGEGLKKNVGDELGKQLGDRFGSSFSTGLLGASGNINRSFRKLRDRMGPDREGFNVGERFARGFARGIDKFKIPRVAILAFLGIPAIGGALQILGAYVAGAVSLIGAIGPAFAAAGAAGLGLFTALGASVGALMLALKAKTPMLDRFMEVKDFFVGEFKAQVGEAVQAALLPALGEALGLLTKIFPVLARGLSLVGGAVGRVAVSLATILTSAESMRNITTILAGSAVTTELLGSALGSVLRIFLNLTAAAQPLTQRFARFFATFAAGLATTTAAANESGRLAAFFQRAGDVAAQLGRIVGNLGRALFGVFSASAPAGQILLDRIEGLTQRFLFFTQSVEGQNKLRAFFDNALPVLQAVNGLIGDILRAVVTPIASGNTGGVIAFVTALRTDVLPALQQLGSAAAQLGPGLTNLTVAFANVLSAAANSGALGAFTGSLTLLFNALARLLSLPVVGDLLGIGLAFAGMAKAASLVLKPFGGLSLITNSLTKDNGILRRALSLLSKAVIFLAKNAIRILIVGLRALSIALLTNPIGLIVTAVVALGAAFYLLYTRSETFRNAIAAIGSALVTAFKATVGFIGSVIGRLLPLINIITQPLQGLIGIVTGLFNVIVGIFTGNLDRITSGVAGMIVGVVRLFFGLPIKVLSAVIRFGPTVLGFFGRVLASLAGLIGRGLLAVLRFFISLPGRILGVLINLPGQLLELGGRVIRFLGSGIAAAVPRIIAFFTGLPGRILSALGNVGSFLLQAGKDLISGLINGIKSMFSNLDDVAKEIGGKVLDGLGDIFKFGSPSKVTTRLGEFIGQGLAGGILDSVKSVARATSQLSVRIG